MLEAARREKEGLLDREASEKFPSQDLHKPFVSPVLTGLFLSPRFFPKNYPLSAFHPFQGLPLPSTDKSSAAWLSKVVREH